MAVGYLPQPGDWAVVNTGTRVTAAITLMEKLDDVFTGSRWTDWDHAVMVTQVKVPGPSSDVQIWIVEAEPGGAVEVPWHYAGRPHEWSSGKVPMLASQRSVAVQTAQALAGERVGYGWLDYAALTAHALHLPAPGLKDFIGDSHRLICSQLVDYCCLQADVHLFEDKRWPGYVTPSDLGSLLLS